MGAEMEADGEEAAAASNNLFLQVKGGAKHSPSTTSSRDCQQRTQK